MQTSREIPPTGAAAPRRRFGWLKYVVLVPVVLVALVAVANSWWLNSGSNTWKLAIDRDGAKIYTLKTPGSAMLKIRGVTTSKEFTLSNHLAPFLDESIQQDCAKWVAGCTRYDILKRWDPKSQSNVTMWTVSLFPPFAPREFLLQGQISQDPATKVVTLENIAVPNRAPPNDCCVRLTHVHNVWRYTPAADGTITIEFVSDLDMAGSFPALLLNLGSPEEIHRMLTVDNPKQLRQDKYRTAKLDFIDEGAPVAQQPEAPAVSAAGRP